MTGAQVPERPKTLAERAAEEAALKEANHRANAMAMVDTVAMRPKNTPRPSDDGDSLNLHGAEIPTACVGGVAV